MDRRVRLGESWHGKKRVRVAKILRRGGRDEFVEYEVEIVLVGGSEESFLRGDNGRVVATDSCRNVVYVIAKEHGFDCVEGFGMDVAKRFLEMYEWLRECRVVVVEKEWRRVVIDGKEHVHGFESGMGGKRVGKVWMWRDGGVKVVGGLKDWSVLKTTQSGWSGFVKDRFTTLPDSDDRILATVVSAEWTYKSGKFRKLRQTPFDKVVETVRKAFVEEFYGPSDKGKFSPGVQHTLYLMAKKAVERVQEIESVTLSLPNLHFLPCTLPVFAKNAIKFEKDVFVPTDEPHGIISATVHAQPAPKL